MEHYIGVLKKYAVFNGRASRMEYWMYFLFSIIASIVLVTFDKLLGTEFKDFGLLNSLYSLAVLLPSLAVFIRRLHDTNRSGWWAFLLLIPFIGFIVILVFLLLESTPGDNKYGPNPNGASIPTSVDAHSSTSTPPSVNPSV